MGENRLIEITTEIYKSNDPLWTIGYVTTLSESEIYLLFRYVNSSRYSDMNLYDALFKFSQDYLKSKKIILDPQVSNEEEKQMSSDLDNVSYLDRMLAGDSSMRTVGFSQKR